MASFKNMKIMLVDAQHSAVVRAKLRDDGYNFCGLRWDDPVFVNTKYLFTYDTNLVMQTKSADYFHDHPNVEYTLYKGDFVTLDYLKYSEIEVAHVEAPSDGSAALIEKQKVVAEVVLSKLFPIDPFAICAGGAPRDWHFGKPATDLDVFFYTAVDQITVVEQMLRSVGIKASDRRSADNLPEWYKLNPYLKCVYESEIDGVTVQLMLMNDKTHTSVVPHFPFTICKAWYKNGKIHLDKEFKLCEKWKIAVQTNPLYNDEHKYIQKLKQKFPEWSFCSTWQEAYKLAFLKGGI